MSVSVPERVRKFVLDNFYVEDPESLLDDTSLVKEGIVDSTGMLEVITFLEDAFHIRVADHETVPANLESVALISDFVQRKLQLRATG